jgi:acetylornithine deacetylase/succinyl-diaminopimelate desuccinylase-like protein
LKKIISHVQKELPDFVVYQDKENSIPHALISKTLSPKIVFACHMDTVMPSFDDHLHPKVEDDKCSVLGGKDMKAGIVSVLGALQTTQSIKAGLLLYGDEEYEQKGIREVSDYLVNILKKKPKVIVCPESRFNLVHSARGIAVIDFVLRGRRVHSARPQQGIDPVKIFFEIFFEIEQEYGVETDLGETLFSLPFVQGGLEDGEQIVSQPNICPDIIKVTVSMRISDTEKDGDDYRRIFTDALEKRNVRVESSLVLNHLSRHTPKEIVNKMVKVVKQKRGVDIEIGDPALAGYNDVAILGEALQCPVVNFGPYGEGNHSPLEWVSLSSIEETEKIFAEWIESL